MRGRTGRRVQMPELIYCADGNRRFAEIAIEAGFFYGAQLPKTVYLPLYFADQDFKRPRYADYIVALRRHRPFMASVLDIEERRRMEEYMMRAEEISRYCSVVMLIPKVVGIIQELPREICGKPVRLGYSVKTKFGGTAVPISEFQDWPIHLLGGSPKKQFQLAREMNVVSADGNYAQKMSLFNEFWDGSNWRELSEHGGKVDIDGPYESFRRSCENIMEMWESDGRFRVVHNSAGSARPAWR